MGKSTDPLVSLLGVCTPCVAWRTTAGAEASRITEKQVKMAEMFEDALQQPRSNLLQSLFPSAIEVAFVPFHRSPQNRCLIAGSELGVQRALDTGVFASAEAQSVLSAIAAARDDVLRVNGTALDLRPHGMVSTRHRSMIHWSLVPFDVSLSSFKYVQIVLRCFTNLILTCFYSNVSQSELQDS